MTKSPADDTHGASTRTTKWEWFKVQFERRQRTRKFLLPAITFAIVYVMFDAVHSSGLVSELLFPSPGEVISEMARQMTSSILWSEAFITLQEAMIGLTIATVIGFLAGVLIGLSRTAAEAVYPFTVLLTSMPRVALAPIIIAIVGFGMTSKIIIVIAMSFFPVLINVIVGLQSARASELDLMRSLCASRLRTLRILLLPGAMPSFFAGLKTSTSVAFVGAIVGEFTSGNRGIGALIQDSSFQLRMDSVIGYIVWLALIAVAVFGLVGWVEKRLVFWKEPTHK